MALLKFDFAKEDSLSAIWEIKESEEDLLKICSLTDYDKELLKNISSTGRRIEILIVRAIINFLNPNLKITYDDRKPVCNYGFISISHSDTLVAVIWHPTKIPTVDIEHINNRIKRIAKRAFNENELNFANDNTELLTKIWSCKECVFKLADTQGIDFKKQIFVSKFNTDSRVTQSLDEAETQTDYQVTQQSNETIQCTLKLDDTEKLFNFSHQSLKDHVLVWGMV